MSTKAATCASFALGILIVALAGASLVVESGCGDDCDCSSASNGLAMVSLACWCSTNDCSLDADAAGAQLCKTLAKGTHVVRDVGCGQIRIGAWAGRLPVGEHYYFDETTGKRAGGFVVGERAFGPCGQPRYGYGVRVECPGPMGTTLCEDRTATGGARTVTAR